MDTMWAAKCLFHCLLLVCLALGLSSARSLEAAGADSALQTAPSGAESLPLAEKPSEGALANALSGSAEQSLYDTSDESSEDNYARLPGNSNGPSWGQLKFREWGKRDLEDISVPGGEQEGEEGMDKKWSEQPARVWGKRAWGGSSRNWGKRAGAGIDGALADSEELLDALQQQELDSKRSWNQNSRMWGKRADTLPLLNEGQTYVDKKWAQSSRMWGKRGGIGDSLEEELTRYDLEHSLDKKWSGQSRTWGKRSSSEDGSSNGGLSSELDLAKKWDSQSRLWGKRNGPETYDGWNTGNTRLWGKRTGDEYDVSEQALDDGDKRQWSGKMRRLWGKRSDEMLNDALDTSAEASLPGKRAWTSQNSRLWGKRAWGNANRNWGKRDAQFVGDENEFGMLLNEAGRSRSRRSADRSVQDLVNNLSKRLWYSDYKRQWGKRSTDDDLASVLDRLEEKRGWNDKSRAWGKRSDYDLAWPEQEEARFSMNWPQQAKRYEPKDYYVIPNLDKRTWNDKHVRLWG